MAAWPLEVPGPEGCWELRLTRESPLIPLQASYDEVHDEGAQLAVLAEAGNRIVAYVRDRQDERRWFLGLIAPGDSCELFSWPSQWELQLLLADGRWITATEIFATRGRADRMGPRIEIFPRGATLRFADFEVTFPAGARCMIWVGFPRGAWDRDQAVALRIRDRRRTSLAVRAASEQARSEELPQPAAGEPEPRRGPAPAAER